MTSYFHLLPGPTVLPTFRQQQVAARAKQIDSQFNCVSFTYAYCIQASTNDIDTERLQMILPQAAPVVDAERSLWIAPRIGTISPWSTKATELLQHCGFENITRIEQVKCLRYAGCEPKLLIDTTVLNRLWHDPLLEDLIEHDNALSGLFVETAPESLQTVPCLSQGMAALEQMNQAWGLALNTEELAYFLAYFQQLQRDPTDVELMMFAQANSEHCRHKIFKANWQIDGKASERSLFSAIQQTYAARSTGVLSAYSDNAAVVAGNTQPRLLVDNVTQQYHWLAEPIHHVIKVETHNHPTAIAPEPGAATGSGGEIRDEGATGLGAKPRAGLCGFSVSNLHIPGFSRAWEQSQSLPPQLATSLEIMLAGPIGAARYNNEFGRPNLTGYFRTFQQADSKTQAWGYHKPIMIAGGLGHIRPQHVHKAKQASLQAAIVVLGGPAMCIGLGGGAASSQYSGAQTEVLDYASVQRANPEMERRAQQVIDACTALAEQNPIISIHDVGAGGLANAIPELLHDLHCGAELALRAIPNAEPSLSPLAIWCNEAQERYVLAVEQTALTQFKAFAEREACPYAVLGYTDDSQQLRLVDDHFNNEPVNVSLDWLLGQMPAKTCVAKSQHQNFSPFSAAGLTIETLAPQVLQFPTVADKSFLITIGDRSITGLVARDQFVGPWQVPVADCAVTLASHQAYSGCTFAMGERSPVAVLDPVASARLAIAEAITNLLSADVKSLDQVNCSANWMAACGGPEQDAALHAAVMEVGLNFCPALGITIPVGKDSLSMRARWQTNGVEQDMRSPLSLIVSAFATVNDSRTILTPYCQPLESVLVLIDLSGGKARMGGSVLAHIAGQTQLAPPDCDDPSWLINFCAFMQQARQQQWIQAYHDRSDGGVFTTLCEMLFASHCGADIHLPDDCDPLAFLFNEECGVVIQVAKADWQAVAASLNQHALTGICLGDWQAEPTLQIRVGTQLYYCEQTQVLHRTWSETSFALCQLRDEPDCALEAYQAVSDYQDPGIQIQFSGTVAVPALQTKHRPKVAILREQGTNGHEEMAAAFMLAGFTAVDVTMSDLTADRIDLADCQGLVACGGFSYGDVLGAGTGWAQSILQHAKLSDMFSAFFADTSKFALGVCNGCQMLSQLRALIPGANHWPQFLPNQSQQFEARFSLVRIVQHHSFWLQGLADTVFPIAVAHGEGQAQWSDAAGRQRALAEPLVAMQYVNNSGEVADQYPANPNGSVAGITGLTNIDGRVLIMMPHPERTVRAIQCSYLPSSWQEEYTPWLNLFTNAKSWSQQN